MNNEIMSELFARLRNPIGWVLYELSKKNDPEALKQEERHKKLKRELDIERDRISINFTLALLNEDQKKSFEHLIQRYLNGEITKKEFEKTKKTFES